MLGRGLVIVGNVLMMTACAPTVWDKPGATQAEFVQDNGRCRLMARQMNSGSFYAEGSPSFVAGASLGNGIATAVNRNETYKDCMMAAGYAPENANPVGQQTQVRPLPSSSIPVPPLAANPGPYDGRWIADVPVQGNCRASHLVLDVRGGTISGAVMNRSGTYSVAGRVDGEGDGTIQINNSSANRGTIRFSGAEFATDYRNSSCGERHANGQKI